MAEEQFQGQPAQGRAAAAAGRARLLDATGKAAVDHGYSDLTVEQVLRYAGLPRSAFDANFESLDQALIIAQDAFLDRLWREVLVACRDPKEWPWKVRAGLRACLSSVVEASALARVFAVEAAAASLGAAERQFAALERFAALLRGGREPGAGEAEALPRIVERALVGGVASIVCDHLLMDEPQAIPARETELVQFILIPYLGHEEALRVASA